MVRAEVFCRSVKTQAIRKKKTDDKDKPTEYKEISTDKLLFTIELKDDTMRFTYEGLVFETPKSNREAVQCLINAFTHSDFTERLIVKFEGDVELPLKFYVGSENILVLFETYVGRVKE